MVELTCLQSRLGLLEAPKHVNGSHQSRTRILRTPAQGWRCLWQCQRGPIVGRLRLQHRPVHPVSHVQSRARQDAPVSARSMLGHRLAGRGHALGLSATDSWLRATPLTMAAAALAFRFALSLFLRTPPQQAVGALLLVNASSHLWSLQVSWARWLAVMPVTRAATSAYWKVARMR